LWPTLKVQSTEPQSCYSASKNSLAATPKKPQRACGHATVR